MVYKMQLTLVKGHLVSHEIYSHGLTREWKYIYLHGQYANIQKDILRTSRIRGYLLTIVFGNIPCSSFHLDHRRSITSKIETSWIGKQCKLTAVMGPLFHRDLITSYWTESESTQYVWTTRENRMEVFRILSATLLELINITINHLSKNCLPLPLGIIYIHTNKVIKALLSTGRTYLNFIFRTKELLR